MLGMLSVKYTYIRKIYDLCIKLLHNQQIQLKFCFTKGLDEELHLLKVLEIFVKQTTTMIHKKHSLGINGSAENHG